MTSTDLQPRDAMELVIAGTGEVFDLTDAANAVTAWNALARFEELLSDYRTLIRARFLAESELLGTKTLHYPEGDAVIAGGPTDTYDAEELREALREAGLPEDRVDEAVKVRIEYRVDKRETKKLAAANPRYRAAIDSVRVTELRPATVTIKPKVRTR